MITQKTKTECHFAECQIVEMSFRRMAAQTPIVSSYPIWRNDIRRITSLFLVYFRLLAAIFDFRHIQTSDSILTSFSVLPDPENMGLAVGISLLSCLRAEIYVLSFLLPVIGRHLRFPTYLFPLVFACCLISKTWLCRWKHVAFIYRS